MKPEGQILKDYKQIGKKFVPPLLYSFPHQFKDSSFIDTILQEVIWQAILNDKLGVSVASMSTLKLLKEIEIARNSEKGKMFCFISSFEFLTEQQIDKILGRLFLDSDFKMLKEALLPFVKVFPECPLKKLFHLPISDFTIDELNYVKFIMKTLLEKTGKETTLVLANTIYYFLQMDRLKVTKDSLLLDLDKIQFYPDTEESKMLASVLRASIHPMVQHEEFILKESKWHKYFWNRAYQIEPFNIDNLYFE